MRITTRTRTVWDIVPIGRIVLLLALALGAFMVRAVCAFPAHAAESQLPAAEMSKEALATVASRAGQMGTINNIEAVASTAGAAAVAFNPHTVVVAEREANAPVTMWVAHGNFDDTLAKTPPGANTPTGTVVAFILNQEEQIAALYVGNTTPALSSLGSPEDFSSPTDSAVVARAAHALPKPPKDRAIVARAAHGLPRPSRVRARAATWGNNCKVAEQYHCYFKSGWYGAVAKRLRARGSSRTQRRWMFLARRRATLLIWSSGYGWTPVAQSGWSRGNRAANTKDAARSGGSGRWTMVRRPNIISM